MPDVCKTPKERERDAKFLETGISDSMIPNSAKRQRIGFSDGIESFKQTKKGDAFRRKNRGKDFVFSL